MLQLEKLQDLKIFAMFEGEKVEIVKLDLINKSVNIKKDIYGKKIIFTYSAKNENGKKLVLENFTNVEISKKN